jgi:hypothetical protein
VLHVVELHGAGSGADHAREAHAARLVAVVGAVVDVIGAVEPREQLEQEAGLVARAAAEVEKRLFRRGPPQLRGDPLHRVGPLDRAVVLRALLEDHRLHEPPGVLQLTRREGPQLRDRIRFEEGRLHGPLHVGHHRLERLLADLGKVARLVHHPARLAAHAKRAGLAGVLRAHRLPEFPEAARLARLLERVHDRAKPAAGGHPAEKSAHALLHVQVEQPAPTRCVVRSGRLFNLPCVVTRSGRLFNLPCVLVRRFTAGSRSRSSFPDTGRARVRRVPGRSPTA